MAVDLVTEDARAIVLVEGLSDRAALEALARRRGRDLAAERISIVAIGGAQRIGRVIGQFGPGGLDLGLAGLVDAGEVLDFQRALERAGLIREATRTGLERLGFYVCERDAMASSRSLLRTMTTQPVTARAAASSVSLAITVRA